MSSSDLLEGSAFDAVRQGQFGSQGNIAVGDGRAAFKGSLGAGGFQDHQVGAVTIHIQGGGQGGNGKQIALV